MSTGGVLKCFQFFRGRRTQREAWTFPVKTSIDRRELQATFIAVPWGLPYIYIQLLNCMLGLRPKLRPRPSLLDLITKHNAQGYQFPPQPHPLSPDNELPTFIPLPTSPSIIDPPTSPQSTATPSIIIMAPSKKQQREDDDEQKGQVFSVSGPVIVAANMLGCAMYELVCQLEELIFLFQSTNKLRSKSVTTIW